MKAELGTVSQGTLRVEDLIPTFLSELPGLSKRAYNEVITMNRDLLAEDGSLISEEEYMGGQDYDEVLQALLEEEVIPALDELAPPYCYFGAHVGDGADFGFWVDQVALDEAVESGEVWRDDGSSPYPEYAEYRLVGEELYRRSGERVW